MEAKAGKLCSMLSSVLEDTKGRIEKKQAQTYEELVAEQQEADEVGGFVGPSCYFVGCFEVRGLGATES